MATITMIRYCVEGNDFLGELRQDVQNIESGDVTKIEMGYLDLSNFLAKNPEFADILKNAYGSANSAAANSLSDAKTYLQSIALQVQRPNTSGPDYITLLEGSSYVYDDGGDDEIGYNGSLQTATLWDLLQNPNMSLTLDSGDCYYDNPNGANQGLGTDWSMSGQINCGVAVWDGNQTDNGMYDAPQASASAWAPFIHMTGGDPSALNRDAFL